MPNLCFNILTFNYPKEELTLYFSKEEDDTLTRLHCNLVPDEIIEKFGQQEHYYTSFEKEVSGFYSVTKPVNPSYEKKEDEYGEEKSSMVPNSAFSISVIKRYYNALIHEYFKNKGFLVKPNFIRDTEIWLPSQKYDNTEKFNLHDRYSLRVQFKTITNHLELLLIYKGIPKVYKQSVEEMQEDVSPKAFNWVLFDNGIYKFDELPSAGKRAVRSASRTMENSTALSVSNKTRQKELAGSIRPSKNTQSWTLFGEPKNTTSVHLAMYFHFFQRIQQFL